MEFSTSSAACHAQRYFHTSVIEGTGLLTTLAEPLMTSINKDGQEVITFEQEQGLLYLHYNAIAKRNPRDVPVASVTHVREQEQEQVCEIEAVERGYLESALSPDDSQILSSQTATSLSTDYGSPLSPPYQRFRQGVTPQSPSTPSRFKRSHNLIHAASFSTTRTRIGSLERVRSLTGMKDSSQAMPSQACFTTPTKQVSWSANNRRTTPVRGAFPSIIRERDSARGSMRGEDQRNEEEEGKYMVAVPSSKVISRASSHSSMHSPFRLGAVPPRSLPSRSLDTMQDKFKVPEENMLTIQSLSTGESRVPSYMLSVACSTLMFCRVHYRQAPTPERLLWSRTCRTS